MKKIYLRQLSVDDGLDIYNMLQRIKKNENEFKNTANGLSVKEYKKWLVEQYNWSKGIALPNGYVPQTIFWLYDKEIPVGIGKIRHLLNENSRRIGGNIGYAIDPLYRGNGYATILLSLLIKKAHEIGVHEILLSVEKCNPASKKVIEKNGGILVSENDERWFWKFQ